MITSNIDDANIIVIALCNIAPKRADANKTIIVHDNTAPTRSNIYVTIIKWQCSSQESKH